MADQQLQQDSLFDSRLGHYYMKLTVGKYSRPTPFEKLDWQKQKSIIFPLPTDLRDDTSVQYENSNLELIGDLVNKNYQGALARSAMNIATDTAAAVGKAGAILLPGIAADDFSAEKFMTTVQQGMGMATNPNPTVAFKGPDLRSFSFTWLLQPRNPAESKKIKDAIQYLKSRSLPANEISNQSTILKYPAIVQMNFFPWDTDYAGNEWGWGPDSIIKLKRCFMSHVNVNYAPSNVPAFFHGTKMPVAIQLTIDFKEIEYMLANDWDDTLAGDSHLGNVLSSLISTSVKPLIDMKKAELNLYKRAIDTAYTTVSDAGASLLASAGASQNETEGQP